jgi:hypothetical protein
VLEVRCRALLAPPSGRRSVARERAPGYAPAPPGAVNAAPAPTLADALGALEAAQDLLAAVDLDLESDRGLLDAAVGLQESVNMLAGAQLRLLERIDRREAHTLDGAATTASWYRARTRLDHGAVARQVQAAVRLRRLPLLRDALEHGRVSLAHVTAITQAAAPGRIDAIAGCEQILVDLAHQAPPRQVKIAVKAITDQIDADGSDTDPLPAHGPDARRELHLHRGVDGLWDLRAIHDPLHGEALATLIDAFTTPDPPDTPAHLRRSPAQRRADALAAAVHAALAAGLAPQVHGVKPHIVASVDLLQLLGIDPHTLAAMTPDQRHHLLHQLSTALGIPLTDTTHDSDPGDAPAAGDTPAPGAPTQDAPVRPPRLRHGGQVPITTMRRLAYLAKITVVLTMGPWRITNVGRTMRTLPAWMRAILDLVHVHCRGPDCDHKITWSQAHHIIAWDDGGDTDLNATIPLCTTHHGWVTAGTWQVDFNPTTGTCTWTGPHGQHIQTHPPTP